jgi:hypothetical protein
MDFVVKHLDLRKSDLIRVQMIYSLFPKQLVR